MWPVFQIWQQFLEFKAYVDNKNVNFIQIANFYATTIFGIGITFAMKYFTKG